MKNIAVVCNYKLNSSRIGGMDRFFTAFDKYCKNKGYKIQWFFSGGEKFDFYRELDLFTAESENVESLFLRANKESHFDVVITHFLQLCTPFYKQVKNQWNPYIVAVDHNPRPLNGFPLKKRLKNKLKGKLYSKYIDLFVGVSEYTKRQILNDYGQKLAFKTKVIYNGIDAKVFRKRTDKNFGKFIVASHLRKSKGIHDLINAVSRISEEDRSKLSIDIFGEGPMENELKIMVREKDLEEQIKFKGSSPKLHELFQQYSYMIQPTYMECFSLSILESLSANVPVLTTPVGGNLEIIKDGVNGYIFKAGDIQNLSGIITDIINNNKHIENAVNEVVENEFHLTRMVKEHASLLENISI